MDPVSHAIIGRLIPTAAASSAPLRQGVAAAGALGALSPDVDFMLMPAGWDIYLRAHEIGTHSLLGACLTGLASAGVVRPFVRGGRYATLAGAAVAGALSHVAADILSGANIRPAWPLIDAAAALPLVAMADPWPIAILAAGVLYRWRVRAPAHVGARRVLLALAAFFTLKALLFGIAIARAAPSGVWDSSAQAVEARWGSLTEWYVFTRKDPVLRQWKIDARADAPVEVLALPIGAESELIEASRALDTVRNFLHVHELAFAVERPAPEGRQAVLWSDIRFCRDRGAAAPECGLWFGGIFTPDGRAVSQQVHVGTWIQRRPLPDR